MAVGGVVGWHGDGVAEMTVTLAGIASITSAELVLSS
jgi:hypothetical protein